jgi:hypothetical protein
MSASAKRVASRHIEAGLLKAPPVLLKSIQEWVSSTLCTHLKAKYPTDEAVKKLPCSAGGNPRSMKYQTIFDLTPDDFRGWPYLRVVDRERQKALARAEMVLGHDVDQIGGVSRNAPLEDWALHFAKGGLRSKGRLDRIKVVVDFNPTKRGGGWFTRDKRYATIYIRAGGDDPRGQYDDGPPTESQIRVWGRIMDGVVEHELLHYTQRAVDAITRQDSAAGLPPQKIRTPDLIQPDFDSLRSDSYEAFQDAVRQHALDDREFYTRLRDEVRYFNQFAHRVYQPRKDIEGIREEWERSRKVWVATPNHRRLMKLQRYGSPEPQPFFRALIDGAPGKWRKAVGEFMAATEASAPVPQTAKPRFPSGRKTHNYTGTDPKIRRMLEDPQPFLDRDVEAYEQGVSALQEGLQDRRKRLVERSRKRVEKGMEPIDIEAKMERITPDPEEYAEAPQLWVQGDYSDVYPGSSTFFPVIRDYAPDLYSQMVAEFKRQVEQPRSSRVASRYREARQDRELVRRADALYRKLLDYLNRSRQVYEDQYGRRVVYGKHLDNAHADLVFLFDPKGTRTFHTEQKGKGDAIVIGVRGLNPFWKGDVMGAGFDGFVKKQRSPIIHELTHHVDSIRFPEGFAAANESYPEEPDGERYFNHALELNAYFIQALADITEQIEETLSEIDADDPDSGSHQAAVWELHDWMEENDDFRKFRERFWRSLRRQVKENLTEKNKRRFDSRLYDTWDKLRDEANQVWADLVTREDPMVEMLAA